MFLPDKYTDRGKWMDGWESRRKRSPGYDWCVIKLGLPGSLVGVDIDTSHFVGNYPAYASIEACTAPGGSLRTSQWTEILQKSPLRPDCQNFFSVATGDRWTHLRLNIFPDGGVARFRAFGIVLPDWTTLRQRSLIDLAAVESGGLVVAASDMFFGSKENLIMPGRARSMGEGWETKRRRGPGNDWAIVQLGCAGRIVRIEVDTNHFKGNAPAGFSLDSCRLPGGAVDALTCYDVAWKVLVPQQKSYPHRRHVVTVKKPKLASHVRLNIYPDGGVSRLRVWGVPEAPG